VRDNKKLGISNGLFHFPRQIFMTSPPTHLLQGEGRIFVTLKSEVVFSIITPPSLAGKGAGGLGHQ